MGMHMISRWITGAALLVFIGAVYAADPPPNGRNLQTATFAGGCFWCLEEALDKVQGVMSTTSGYTGGRVARPTYEQVSSGGTGHVEAVHVLFDPARVSYARLLEV